MAIFRHFAKATVRQNGKYGRFWVRILKHKKRKKNMFYDGLIYL